ncbi:MAG: MATE family efflux transporter [Oscillospiraceae bacterium]|nr:MATE family efflux transporter [Oscillospiraceae bacterium]
MRFLVRDKSFYKSFATLTIIISLQSLITFSVNLADNIMIGNYSETGLSGVTIVNQIQFLLQMIAGGVGGGVVVFGAQYWGKKEIDPIRKIIALGLKFSLAAGIIFFLAGKLMPYRLLRLLTNDENVIEAGLEYLSIISFTYIVFCISNTLVFSLRSVESTIIGTVVSLFALVSNITLNYGLIYGRLGMPELGIRGAAIATLISRCVELAVVVVYLLFIDKKLKLRPKHVFTLDFSDLRRFTKVSLPVVVTGGFWGLAMSVQTAIMGHMSAETIAASSISGVVFQVAAVLGMCSSSSSSVLIGKVVGERRFDMIKPYTRTLQFLYICIGLFCGIVLYLVREPILSLYNISQTTHDLAMTFMTVLSFSVVCSSYEYPVEGGIIQGGGNTRYPFIVDTICMWGFTLPLSYLSAFVWHLDPLYTFMFLRIDQLLKCFPNAITVNRYKWIKEVTLTK